MSAVSDNGLSPSEVRDEVDWLDDRVAMAEVFFIGSFLSLHQAALSSFLFRTKRSGSERGEGFTVNMHDDELSGTTMDELSDMTMNCRVWRWMNYRVWRWTIGCDDGWTIWYDDELSGTRTYLVLSII